ncbi:SGNH/GDSL hydrolase family protein [Luteolibacter marinus]|uniref:SGNH/GDSL hydrolase family protein n=1 Tax=Luteolibacter marinus TaxID=2776705 RepID=UPI0018678E20|nr:SGNH/GDSL hydrolase family protein [Luteolibacter marinus]
MPFTTCRTFLISLLLTLASGATPLRVLAIGDSMTEEYAFELTFSAPASDTDNANTRSWPELFRIFRPTEVSLGPYESTAPAYGDLRIAGHEWNFGIPGMTTDNWFNLINTDDPFDPPSGEPLGYAYYETRSALIDQLSVAEAVVILLGANDLKQDYNDLFNDTEADNFFNRILNRLAAVRTFVRTYRPNVPIVLCTVPDVGATPQISGIYNDPAKQATTRAKIAAFNEDLVAWAAGLAVPPTVARIDHLTDRLFDENPFHLNGTIFTVDGSNQNPPDHVFCRDDFHVSTVGQALIANEIIGALETATGRELTPFSDREILQNLLGLDPDQPYLDWIAAAGLAGSGMDEDPDHDGLPNLVEQLLGTSPGDFSEPFAGSFAPGSSLSWQPDPTALRYATLTAEESGNLMDWLPVPAARTNVAPDGTVSVTPATAERGFVRLNAVPR